MSRKIIQLSPSTHVVSLPVKWLRDNNIKKGDEIFLTPYEEGLLLKSKPKQTSSKITLDLRSTHNDRMWALVDAAYIAGYKEFEVLIEPKNTDIFHKLIRYFPGFVVTEERKGVVIAKDISDPIAAEFEKLLTRVYHMVSDMIADAEDAYKNKEWNVLDRIKYRDYVINSYTSYAIRQLLVEPKPETEKSLYMALVKQTEKFSDIAAKLLTEISRKKGKQEIINQLKQVAKASRIQWQKKQESKELFSLAKVKKVHSEIADAAFDLYETGLQISLLVNT